MATDYEQRHTERGYQSHDQQPYQQYEGRARQQHDQQAQQHHEQRSRQPQDQQNESRSRQQYDQQPYQQYEAHSRQQYEPPSQQPHEQRGRQQHDQQPHQQYEPRGRQQPDSSLYQPYERAYPQDDQAESQHPQQRPSIPERGRAIRLMKNGDPYFTGRAFVINQRRYPVFDVFLDDASQALRANFGAVRNIYTPKHGTRLKDISELEDHRTYVAGGGERFKKLHYLDIAEGKRIATKGPIAPKYQLPPVRRVDAAGRAMKLSRSENMIIYVYRNGDQLTLPAKILLVKSILQSWESILDEITRKVTLSHTAVLKLYAMNGELITSTQQLEYNGMYVAAGKERFRRVEYPDPKSYSANSSPKMSRKSSKHQLFVVRPQLRLPPLQRRRDDSSADHDDRAISSEMQQRYMKNDGPYTYTTTTATSHGSTENPGQRRPVREEYDFFNNKPQQHRRGPLRETDLDRDDGGVYKGRSNHRERVREIEDTRDTKVDVPVEHRRIETVDDEDYYGNTSKIPRRQQPLSTQSFSDVRQKSTKSPAKNFNGDDNHHAYNDHRNHSYDRRTPPQLHDDPIDPHRPHRERRPSYTSSKTLANRNKQEEEQAATVIQSHIRGYLTRQKTQQAQQQRQMQSEGRNGYPYSQPSQRTERDYDKHKDYA